MQKEHSTDTDETTEKVRRKNTSCEAVCSGTKHLGVPEHHTSKRDKKAIEEMERAVYDNGKAPAGSVLSLEYKACGALRKSETASLIIGRLVRTTEHGRIEYLQVEPACEVNEKCTREKTDGNENVSMDDNEKIEVDSDEGSFAEEDWIDPEQNEVPKWMEPDLQMMKKTRKGGRKKTSMRYNRYSDDFLIDKKQPAEIGEELVNVGELVANEEWRIINDSEHSLHDDHTKPEREMDLEQSEIERRENTKLRILEWMHNLEADEKEAQSIQQVDVSATKHLKTENPLFGWTATDRPLKIPSDNLSHVPSTGMSINSFLREWG